LSLSLVEDQISDPHIYAHSSTLRISTKNETPLPFPLSFPACVHYICSGRGRKYLRQRKRQPQVPPRPIVLVQRRPDLLQTAQRRGACLHSLVFYQTVFVLLLSIRIKIIFIIIIPSHAGSWLLPLQGRHLLQRSNSLLSTWSDLRREGRAMPGRFLQPLTCPDGAQGAKELGRS